MLNQNISSHFPLRTSKDYLDNILPIRADSINEKDYPVGGNRRDEINKYIDTE